MAKSKIIKDLANGSVDTMVALKRAKVLLSEFNNEDILNWINYEIMVLAPGGNDHFGPGGNDQS